MNFHLASHAREGISSVCSTATPSSSSMAPSPSPTCCVTTIPSRTAPPASRRPKTPSYGADRITHETGAAAAHHVRHAFDRDEIHRLISRMDDVLDLIQDTAESLVLY
jgi:hypothetical protein